MVHIISVNGFKFLDTAKVFASVATWGRYIREMGWRRPRTRIHPSKPTEGFRSDTPDGMWHIDVTVIRLLDGTKAYLQAIIDNYSRRILAWRLSKKLEPASTAVLLIEAFKSKKHVEASVDESQSVMFDRGVENLNNAVNELCNKGVLKLILDQTHLHFSNSMIEAFWRTLKHQWLYLNSLDSFTKLNRLVQFYINEYNSTLHHSAFKGQTPDEMYFGKGADIEKKIELGKKNAREIRTKANQELECDICKESSKELSLVC